MRHMVLDGDLSSYSAPDGRRLGTLSVYPFAAVDSLVLDVMRDTSFRGTLEVVDEPILGA